jgi:serine/threonine protein kinase
LGPFRECGIVAEGPEGALLLVERAGSEEPRIALGRLFTAGVDDGAWARFEADATAGDHAGEGSVAPLVARGRVADGGAFAVWDRQGTVVAARLSTAGGAVPEAAKTIARDVAEAVAALHNAGLVHGALTARAVSVDEETGRVVVGDVGLRHLVPASSLALAPEQTAGQPPTFASDVWALGALLRDLVTTPATTQDAGTTEEASAATAQARRSRPTRPLPEALAPIIARAMAESPSERYPDARAFAEALAAVKLGRGDRPDDEELTLAAGTVIGGRWRVVRTLGAGGMGAVVEAEHSVLAGKRVAAKLLHPDFARDPDMAARFLREAQMAARLRHPNVVAVEDVLEDPPTVRS